MIQIIIMAVSLIISNFICLSVLHMKYKTGIINLKSDDFDKELGKLYKKENIIKLREGRVAFYLMHEEVRRISFHLSGTEPVLGKCNVHAWNLLNKYNIRNIKYEELKFLMDITA